MQCNQIHLVLLFLKIVPRQMHIYSLPFPLFWRFTYYIMCSTLLSFETKTLKTTASVYNSLDFVVECSRIKQKGDSDNLLWSLQLMLRWWRNLIFVESLKLRIRGPTGLCLLSFPFITSSIYTLEVYARGSDLLACCYMGLLGQCNPRKLVG